MMTYKGYFGRVEFDDEAGIFHGEVVNTRDVITFQGTTVKALRQSFHESVDDYLDFCRERGEDPDKPFSGQFVTRLSPDLHRKISEAASISGKSLNAWIVEQLERSLGTLGRTQDASESRIHEVIGESQDIVVPTEGNQTSEPIDRETLLSSLDRSAQEERIDMGPEFESELNKLIASGHVKHTPSGFSLPKGTSSWAYVQEYGCLCTVDAKWLIFASNDKKARFALTLNTFGGKACWSHRGSLLACLRRAEQLQESTQPTCN